MARLATLALVLLSGCVAAVDFDAFSRPQTDAGAPTTTSDAGNTATDAGAEAETGSTTVIPPKFVQSGTAFLADNGDAVNTVLDVGVAPTVAGNMLIMAIAIDDGNLANVQSVSDDKNDTFTSASLLASDPNASNTDQVWYAKAAAGVTQVEVTLTRKAPLELWAIEVSGVTTLDTGEKVDSDGNAHDFVAAPKTTPSVPSAFVLSVASSSQGITGLQDSTLFTTLPVQNGNDAAWAVTTTTGSYGAAWNLGASGTTCALTVAFR